MNSQKKRKRPSPNIVQNTNEVGILTEQAWSVLDLLYGFRKKKNMRDEAGCAERTRFDSSCPLTELAI